jgi:hypothetical protein
VPHGLEATAFVLLLPSTASVEPHKLYSKILAAGTISLSFTDTHGRPISLSFSLTLWSPLLTTYATCFNKLKLRILLIECVSRTVRSHNKQRCFPWAPLTCSSLHRKRAVFSVSYELHMYLNMPPGTCLSTWCTLVSCSAYFLPWRWKRCVPPKRRLTYGLHGSIPQRMATFITTAVRTSNPTFAVII